MRPKTEKKTTFALPNIKNDYASPVGKKYLEKSLKDQTMPSMGEMNSSYGSEVVRDPMKSPHHQFRRASLVTNTSSGTEILTTLNFSLNTVLERKNNKFILQFSYSNRTAKLLTQFF